MERPIGYWLKHVDALIEEAFSGALAESSLSRRDWQVLNTLAGAPLDEPGLAEALRPFWGESGVTLDEVIQGLARRDWIERGADGRYALTSDGQAARAAVAERVEAIRTRMTNGVTPAAYEAAVEVLRRMADNLAAPAAQPVRPSIESESTSDL
jgi:DNA-binding MarR family transcriptional regulator